MRAITIMGMAGSGKSTVAKEVAEQLGYHYCSTGDLARKLIDGEWAELGLFAPESAMRAAFEEDIKGHEIVVLDGMPRKPQQVPYLDTLFNKVDYYVISIDDDTATERLMERGREDDTPAAIKQRLLDWKIITSKAVDKARRRRNQITTIDGTLSTDDIVSYIVYRHTKGGN
jgi:adenylate kinase family enzyme